MFWGVPEMAVLMICSPKLLDSFVYDSSSYALEHTVSSWAKLEEGMFSFLDLEEDLVPCL